MLAEPGKLKELLALFDDRACILQNGMPRARQDDATITADQERNADFQLQVLNLAEQGRRGYVQSFRGTAEGLFLGYRDKIP
jgi:hypothetical protein